MSEHGRRDGAGDDAGAARGEAGGGNADEDRPLADRRADQGARPSPDEEIAAESEPSPSDPASYDRDSDDSDEPPERPTRA
ncbi:hypothetical protein [Streptomonospora wellingtoniae]|uniref:Uncharacterized protein n=1 Tax=Streptomonospora wellingtoniae TaxID=3075544 RepID=A0ABU2KU68_9ACTN|nr:hypothetical protein [Streptomonospora sp. DSM 45055]MDT0302668.1 hypothetical protein [Streptomonospora sp. DSM 45055]